MHLLPRHHHLWRNYYFLHRSPEKISIIEWGNKIGTFLVKCRRSINFFWLSWSASWTLIWVKNHCCIFWPAHGCCLPCLRSKFDFSCVFLRVFSFCIVFRGKKGKIRQCRRKTQKLAYSQMLVDSLRLIQQPRKLIQNILWLFNPRKLKMFKIIVESVMWMR